MQILRTPDACFEGLVDWPYPPHYVDINAADGTQLRLAYVDEGPRDAPPVLLMHGEPSWSYLYRHVIAGLIAKGHRVLAPDLIGFGRSDKPAARTDYTYEGHVGWISQWLIKLDLHDVTLFCQDWGGLLGLRLVAAFPDRFSGVIAANTGLPVGSGWTEAFTNWLRFSQEVPSLPIGRLLDGGSARSLSDAEIAAYDAPFPDDSFKEGARQFPLLVPVTPDHASVAENIAAWKVLERFDKPFMTAFSDADAVTRGGEKGFQERIPGARHEPHTILPGGHFLQEDSPAAIVDLVDALVKRTH